MGEEREIAGLGGCDGAKPPIRRQLDRFKAPINTKHRRAAPRPPPTPSADECFHELAKVVKVVKAVKVEELAKVVKVVFRKFHATHAPQSLTVLSVEELLGADLFERAFVTLFLE